MEVVTALLTPALPWVTHPSTDTPTIRIGKSEKNP